MNSTIFIPKKIKVGCQHRDDTYTKKLAYVIYYDNKGVLRKEKSWRGWIHDTDEEYQKWVNGKYETVKRPGIKPEDFENVPTEGFVLNKKVGGTSNGWDHRQTYCRVYDPRGFEFEITIPNLLFILENASAIKGKGLEGKFVYGWEGKDIVLIPEESPEYKGMLEYTDNQNIKMKKNDFVPGLQYMTKRNEIKTYLGFFPQYSTTYKRDNNMGSGSYVDVSSKKHWFASIFTNDYNQNLKYLSIEAITGLSTFAKKVSDEYDPRFGEYLNYMERREDYSPIDYDVLVDVEMSELDKFVEKSPNYTFHDYYVKDEDGAIYSISGNLYYLNNEGYKERKNVQINDLMVFKNKRLVKDRNFADFNYNRQNIEREKYCKKLNIGENELITKEDLINKLKIKKIKTYLQNGNEKGSTSCYDIN